jgi:hypothetical protein
MCRGARRRRGRGPSPSAAARRQAQAQWDVRSAYVDGADGALLARGLHRALVAVLAALGQQNLRRGRDR